VDQAQLAREILFAREFTDPVLDAGGWDVKALSTQEKEQLIGDVQARTTIENEGRRPITLIRIAHTDSNPVRAFSIAQRYTSLFLEESVKAKQEESRSAFEFIASQVASYQAKLQASENRLSRFKSENNFGTLQNANNRIDGYRAEMERLDLEIMQLDTQITSVESQLAGETEVSRDLSQVNAVRARINELQMRLDGLRVSFHDSYPDVVAVKNQIADLQEMLESGRISVEIIEPNDSNEGSATPLRQQLRSQLAGLRTNREAKISQREGLSSLLVAEQDRARLINTKEAELAELTRDYNVTQDFYNEMLRRLENARVSMHLDEEQQGVTFKIQESAVVPTQPDGFSMVQMMAGSFLAALAAPIGLLVLLMELDTRVRSESKWSDEWPPLLATVPPMWEARKRAISNVVFASIACVALVAMYGTVGTLYYLEII
jgi:polysaccharide chain length determinant protein (PEP-CTERM system associated)